jgi:RNA polymerase sigma factor (sigma-70 family)
VTPDADPSDSALAGRAALGDERAFTILVQRHQEPLYRLLRRYTGDSDEAYEAAHEAFIAAWSAMERYDPTRSFGAWLRTIAINKARDRGRRMAFRWLFFGSKPLEDNEEAMGHPDPAQQADEAVAEHQEVAVLDRAVARLPAILKEALILTAFEGLTQQEAAEILKVTVKTIETRVYRARKILADALDPSLRPVR